MENQEKPKPRIFRRKNATPQMEENKEQSFNEIAQINMETTTPTLPKNKKTMMQKIKKLITKKNLLILLFVILAVGFAYYFSQYKKLTKDPKAVAKEKTAQVIKQISALAVVPTDPNAVLANVTDVTKLKDQPFFKDAQNGDEIVIFPSAMRAVLYRPSINKIINIGPLSSNPTTTTETPTTTKTTTPTKTTTKK